VFRSLLAALAAVAFLPAADAQPIRKALGRVQTAAGTVRHVAHDAVAGAAAVCIGHGCQAPSVAESAFLPVPAVAPQPMPAGKPKVVAAAANPPATTDAGSKIGSGFCALVRAELRKEYRKQGMTFSQAWKAAAEFDDETIRGAVSEAEKLSGKVVGQLGDGTLLKILLDFINSPTGQMILQLVIKLLLGGLDPAP